MPDKDWRCLGAFDSGDKRYFPRKKRGEMEQQSCKGMNVVSLRKNERSECSAYYFAVKKRVMIGLPFVGAPVFRKVEPVCFCK